MQFPDAHTATLAGACPTHARRAEPEYRPFPNESGRNTRQATIEVPLMVRALGLPRSTRSGCSLPDRPTAPEWLHRSAA